MLGMIPSRTPMFYAEFYAGQGRSSDGGPGIGSYRYCWKAAEERAPRRLRLCQQSCVDHAPELDRQAVAGDADLLADVTSSDRLIAGSIGGSGSRRRKRSLCG